MNSMPSPARVDPGPTDEIETIRAFNRFYTRHLGLLDRGLLGSEFTLTECRVLYELAHRERSTATEIAEDLSLDFGYLSRLLQKFERLHFVERRRSKSDGRQSWLKLTRQGQTVFTPLNRAAVRQIATIIADIGSDQRRELVGAMRSIRQVLEPARAALNSCQLRSLRVGDIGWITHRQGLLYRQEYGWDQTYEALVAEILAGFVKHFNPALENAWVAEREAAIIGSVFLVRASASVAKLRLLYVEPSARGSGVGMHLVQTCIGFARTKGYRTLSLWTNDVLASARRIYESAGFLLKKEEPHQSFGKDLIGQTWELNLSSGLRPSKPGSSRARSAQTSC